MSFARYPDYKDSGVEWLGEVPGHWEVKRLRFVAELNPSKSEAANIDRDTLVSFLPMDAIGEDGSLRFDVEKPIRELESGYTYFRNGDVTVAKITPCYENGKGALMLGLLNGMGFGTTELIVARPYAAEITGQYLHYLFISPDFRSLGESHMYGAGGQKRVPDAFVRNFSTAFPPLSEQTQIAAFLDRETAKIDGLVAEQRRLMALLKEKRQAVISHAVTQGLNPLAPMMPSGIEWLGDVPEHWEVGPVKRFFASHNPRRVPLSGEERSGRSGNFPYYGASGIIDYIDEFIFEEDLVLVSEDGANLVNRSTPIAFVATGKYWVNNHAHILQPLDRNLIFWAECLESIDLMPFITGSAQPKLTSEALNALMISVPPTCAERLLIQNHIVAETDKLDTLTIEAQRAIDLLAERRTALISAAVTGQIDVRALT